MDEQQLEKEYKTKLNEKYNEVIEVLENVAVDKFKEELDLDKFEKRIKDEQDDAIKEIQEERDKVIEKINLSKEALAKASEKFNKEWVIAKEQLGAIKRIYEKAKETKDKKTPGSSTSSEDDI